MRNLRKSHASNLSLNKSSKTKNFHVNTLPFLINRAAVQLPYHLKGTFEKSKFYYKSQITYFKNRKCAQNYGNMT